MRFSYWPSSQQSWEQLLASAAHVEATGWDGIWVADHFMPGFGDELAPWQECWTVLAGLAVAVPRVRLGSLVSANTYRHPALLAKMAVTVDQQSGGRAVLGIGAGWQENEHRAYGFELGTPRWRLDRLDEACTVIRALLEEERANVAGEHYTLVDAPLSPKPVTGHLPLMIGGGGEQRTLRIVARHADEWNVWGTPDHLAHKAAVLDRWCDEIGRDPATIERSAVALLFLSDDQALVDRLRAADLPRPAIIGGPAEVVDVVCAYRDAGVDELVIPDFNLPDPVQRHQVLDRFISEVVPQVVGGAEEEHP